MTSHATRHRVGILGAGPHGLAAALHLLRADPSLADELLVIDPSGTWMSTWNQQFARLDIDVLRSPGVHHPGPDVDALSAFVDRNDAMVSGLPYDPPMATTFAAFNEHLVAEAGLSAPLALQPRAITPDPDGGLLIDANAATFSVERLIVATNPHRRTVPDWVWPLCGQTKADLAHAADVDLASLPNLTGEHVAVVGGGLTAAHLAIGAARRGAHAHLISRRSLESRPFDTDPGWLGPKYLRDFEACADPAERRDLALAARGGGTMPSWMRRRVDRDDISLHEGAEIVGVSPCGDAHGVELDNGETIRAHRLWLATGTSPHLDSLRCIEPLLPDIAAVEGLPVTDDDLRVGLHPVHVMGRLAMLTLGPASGNLWGARHAARRITRAIVGVDIDPMGAAPRRSRPWRSGS